jgi:transglutaminase-like putative cysteine protease
MELPTQLLTSQEQAIYLAASHYIDWRDEQIQSVAKQLASGAIDRIEIAKACFEFVRDQIKHSVDFQMNPVTCKASDVLKYGTGYCYAKSHLLAALLRANNIPAGLCYQRLAVDEQQFCLHGLNAVYLEEHGWYKIDPRGNTANIRSDFCPPLESLAFMVTREGEVDFANIYAEPLPVVVSVLEASAGYLDVLGNLPDGFEGDWY